MYWNIKEILPYQRNFNFINGERSIGKTYTTLKYFIQKCIDNNTEFVYITRTQEEKKNNALESAVQKVVLNEFQNYEFDYNFESMYLKHQNVKQIIGHCVALSEAVKIKKRSFPNVKYLIFDEYMLEMAQNKSYVNGWKEPDLFLSIYHTIDREEDRVVCFLLGNNTSFYNPYHMHSAFNIPNIEKGKIWKSKFVLFQWAVSSKDLKEKKSKSKYLQMIDGSNYGRYAKDGNYIDDKESFILKRNEPSKYLFTIKFNDNDFGVWSGSNNLTFIDNKFDPSSKLIYTISINDHDEQTKLLKNSSMIKWVCDSYKIGNVRFTNMRVKKLFTEILKFIM